MTTENKDILNVELEKSIDRIRTVQSRMEHGSASGQVTQSLMRHHLRHAIASLEIALEALDSTDSEKVGA